MLAIPHVKVANPSFPGIGGISGQTFENAEIAIYIGGIAALILAVVGLWRLFQRL
jgi:uncharacterized membrane protein